MGFHRSRRGLVILAFVIACGSDPAPEPAPTLAAAPQLPSAPEPSSPGDDEPMWRHAVSTANTTNEIVSSCMNWSAEASLPSDVARRESKTALLTEMFVDGAPPVDEGSFTLPEGRTCEDMFSDRTAFATCRSSVVEEAAGVTLTFATFSYDAGEVYESDALMRECVGRDGEWTAIPRDSDAAELALQRLELRRLQRGR